jgi:hypothetical protein
VVLVVGALTAACPNLGALTGAEDGGASEAGAGSETGATGGWCATHPHTFCEDFDDKPLGAAWAQTTTAGGALALDPDASVSPPLSLLVTTFDAGPQDNGIGPLLSQTLGDGKLVATVCHCEFDLRVDQVSPSRGYLDFFGIALNPSGPPVHQVTFGVDITSVSAHLGFGTQFTDGGVQSAELSLQPFTFGQWGHFVIDVQLSGGGKGMVKTSIDGALSTSTFAAPEGSLSQTISIGGKVANPPSSGWQVRFDNVWCDVSAK